MKLIKGFFILPAILIVLLISFIIFLFLKGNINQSKTNNNLPFFATNSDIKPNQIRLTGMVWTSGLRPEEKEVLEIDSDYQIEKPLNMDYLSDWGEKTDGMYLVSESSYYDYLGKCVTITGEIKEGWENLENQKYEINGKWTYGRSALIPDKVEIIDFDKCLVSYDRTSGISENQEYESFSGVLGFAKRPAPDIHIDFVIILNEPYLDEQNASGKPVLMKQLEIKEDNDEIYRKMLENTGKKVKINGYWQWGYAESRFLRVIELLVI